MIEARNTTPNHGNVVVACDNPQHPTRRFPTVALAESYLVGNAVMGDCLAQHSVSEPMRDLGDLLALLLPIEGDNDDCEAGR